MNCVESVKTHCPYYGKTIELLVDCSLEEQSYMEDCLVCCRPITVNVQIGLDGIPLVQLYDENT